MKKTVLEFACVLGLALIAGGVYNAATGKLEFFVKSNRYPDALVCKKGDGGSGGQPPQPGKTPVDPPDPDRVPHIAFEEAVEAWRDGLLFIDARTTKRYLEGHIPGAVSIGAYEPGIDDKVARLSEDEPLAAPVVIYCTKAKDCEDSHIVASHLKEFGFLDLKIFEGGFPEWLQNSMPVHPGEEPGPRGLVEGGDSQESEGRAEQ